MSVDRLPVGQGQWVCDPNFLVCQSCDTLITFYKGGFRANWNDVAGAIPFMCENCRPPTFFMGVFTPLPAPMVTCYPLSRESYVQWDTHRGKFPPTPELLYHLRDPHNRSFNPHWLPATNRRTT